jgi:cysteine-rich repeat protein
MVMRGYVTVAVMMMSACVTDPTVACGAVQCPAGDVCTPGGCATRADAEICAGKAEDDRCTNAIGLAGACVGGACRAVICGDGIIEPGEVCDDGNTVSGDGCSSTCDSTEVCGNGVVDQIRGEECDDGLVGLSSDGCSSNCKLERPLWRDVTPIPISARAGIAMAYDVARARTVVFGGFTLDALLDETWENVGGQWQRVLPITSPPGRQEAAIFYDRMRQRVVLFGGVASVVLGDMWEFDGLTWTELHPAHMPPPRGGAQIAYDPQRNRAVLYGGTNNLPMFYSDTWEWDGTDWTEIHPAMSPGARYWFQLAYDNGRSRMMLYGGLDGSNAYRYDTWTYDGTTWTPQSPSVVPTTSYLGGMVYDPDIDRVVLVGNGATPHWAWNGTSWAALSEGTTKPGESWQFGLVYDETAHELVMFGGADNSGILGNTWTYQSATWQQPPVVPTNPDPRGYAGTAYDARRGCIVIFGGFSGFGDTWELTARGWLLRTNGPSPPARRGAGMTYDGDRGRTVMFGGDNGAPLADTWEWDGQAWASVTPTTSPPARQDPMLVYDAAHRQSVLFGGDNGSTYFADTWLWNGSAWTQASPATSPQGRSRAAMAYDPIRARVVLFGGFDGVTARDGTWEWDGTTWTDVSPATGPAARNWHSLTYDPQRRRVVLFGGIGNLVGETFDDVWEWDGKSWTEVAPATTTPGRYGTSLAYDAVNRRLVRFGGRTIALTSSNDTWQLAYESSEPIERCVVATADDDGDGLAGCADPDCWGRCAPLCPPGAPCPPNAPRCGDGTCSAVEDRFICPADCP